MVIVVFIFLLLYFKPVACDESIGIGLIGNFLEMARSGHFLDDNSEPCLLICLYHCSFFITLVFFLGDC